MPTSQHFAESTPGKGPSTAPTGQQDPQPALRSSLGFQGAGGSDLLPPCPRLPCFLIKAPIPEGGSLIAAALQGTKPEQLRAGPCAEPTGAPLSA